MESTLNTDKQYMNLKKQTEFVQLLEQLFNSGICDVNDRIYVYNSTWLIEACKMGLHILVEYLSRKNGINHNARDIFGRNGLHYASCNGHFDIVKYLIENTEIDPNIRDMNGCTALHYSSKVGYCGVTDYLINRASVDPNVQNNHGLTALHLAVIYENIDCVLCLLKCNIVDVTLCDKENTTAKDIVISRFIYNDDRSDNTEEIFRILDNYEPHVSVLYNK